jgi:DNA-binding NarL/FixJ family response regulator
MYAIIIRSREIFRKGLRLMLAQRVPHLVTEACQHPGDFIEKAKNYGPTLVLIDLEDQEPGGLSLLTSFRQQHAPIKVIALSHERRKSVVFQLLELGVEGYLFEDASGEEVAKAVNSVLQQENYYDRRVVGVMHQRMLGSQASDANPIAAPLTEREAEILRLICQEHTNKEIGDILGISRRTVDGHRIRLMRKCRAKNTAGLIYYSIEQGLVSSQRHSA